MLNDFRHLGFNQAENGKKVFDGMMQWIAAGDGINMNYRFSQPGRTERNRQDQLYVEGVFPFANVTTHDPITGKTEGRYERVRRDRHLSARDGDLLGERILGEGGLAVAHRSRRARRICRISRARGSTSCRAMQHGTGNADAKGQLPAVPESAGFGAGTARAVGSAGRMVDQRHDAAAEQGSAARRRHARAAAAAGEAWASRTFRASPTPV